MKFKIGEYITFKDGQYDFVFKILDYKIKKDKSAYKMQLMQSIKEQQELVGEIISINATDVDDTYYSYSEPNDILKGML